MMTNQNREYLFLQGLGLVEPDGNRSIVDHIDLFTSAILHKLHLLEHESTDTADLSGAV
jgi:hypothetical protein